MPVNTAYVAFLKHEIRPVMISAGFAQHRELFMRTDSNISLVRFQRWSRSTGNEIKFTINLGIIDMRLVRFFGEHVLDVPDLGKAKWHWQVRIGNLLPDGLDLWWEINSNESSIELKPLANVVRTIITDVALPELRKVSTDFGLEAYWCGGGGGAPELEIIGYLMAFAAMRGDEHQVEKLEMRLRDQSRDRPWSRAAEIHIRYVRSYLSNRPRSID